ncbi:hypothetical protein [Dolosicoccus paucivorans]|uniref:hypothetical protein n=1 Tax=Dolosicoccus paucivorans TaxID=84521 RepID=UPI0008804756|nr:hypothetical protein [Dolosicoccus paucivorans]SDI80077.1 hypothetical protein SAMN04487994_10496 [Dolosicoccus paucivorans]
MNNTFKEAQLELLIDDGTEKGAKLILKGLKEGATGDVIKEVIESFDSLIDDSCQEAVTVVQTHYFA